METPVENRNVRRDQWKVPEPGIGDRLSYLPEEIRCYILSFLPTKYAAGTAVLSRRWKDVWTRVSNLDFDNRLVYKDLIGSFEFDNLPPDHVLREMGERRELEFSRFFDRVVRQHNNLNSLRRFRLHSTANQYNRKVKADSGLERELVFGSQVEEIDVMLIGETEFGVPRQIPESFYTLKKLEVVKLNGVIMSANGYVSLPSLKILELQKVVTTDFESLSRFLSGCPVVETLHLEISFCLHTKESDILTASLPSLRNLTIIDFLADAVIETDDRGGSYQDLIRVLTQISNSKKMCLNDCTMEILSSGGEDVQLPVFPNLTHLTIERTERCRNSILYSLLHSAPKLQSLVIALRMEPMMWEEAEPSCTPECLISTLEKIEIKEFLPYNNDMKMVGYLLNAGAVLKKVDIHALNLIGYEECKELAPLLKLPRGSSASDVRILLDGNEIEFDIVNDEIEQ